MIKQQFIPLSATGRRPGIAMRPEYITIHSTTNTATAQNEADNVCNNNPTRKVSFHIVVDDKQAIQVLPFNEVAWHAGDGFDTGNLKSIGIEICEGGDRVKALMNAAEVVRDLMTGYKIDRNHVARHKDWSGKNCPRILIDPLHIKNGMNWSWFLSRLDPPKAHWAQKNLESLVTKGIIKSPEAHSDLNKAITKGELFAIIDRIYK